MKPEVYDLLLKLLAEKECEVFQALCDTQNAEDVSQLLDERDSVQQTVKWLKGIKDCSVR